MPFRISFISHLISIPAQRDVALIYIHPPVELATINLKYSLEVLNCGITLTYV